MSKLSRVRFAVPATLIAACSSCTMYGALDRHVPSENQDENVGDDRYEPWSHYLGGHGLRLGGSPGAIRVASNRHVVEVQCRDFGWNQYTFGLILPVIPVPMGAGPYVPQLGVRLRVADDSLPVVISLEDVLVTPAGGGEPKRPTGWSPDLQDYPGTRVLPLPLGEPVTLSPEKWAWVYFDVDNRQTEAFYLAFNLDGEQVRVRFDKQCTPFLFTVP